MPDLSPGALTPAVLDDGVCRQVDADIMFPHARNLTGLRAAVALCSVCSVRQECRDFALDTAQEWGVWGGLTEAERSRLTDRAAA